MRVPAMMRVRLKRVVSDVGFRYGIAHHVAELRKQRKLDIVGADECVLLVSRTQRQLAFVFPLVDLGATRTHEQRAALTHLRVQLSHSSPWNPLMLANYAGSAGIEIVGLKRFEDHLGKQLAALRAEWGQ